MTSHCIEAVKRGDLQELKRLVNTGHPLNKVLTATAISHRQYHIFEWLKEQGCDAMGIEVRRYNYNVTGVGKTQTLNENEKRYDLVH